MAEKKSFYVTTPIYYGNGLPHVGHFYSSMIANIIHKYHKISGYESRFTTGIDENSQKSVIKAEEEGLKLEEYLGTMAGGHKKVWDHFDFDYTDFIRTTEPRHHTLVQEVLDHCYKKGDIYQGEYEGMYCVGCESFKKDDDLVYLNKTSKETFPISPKVKLSENIIKVCPDHLKTPDTIKEKNYFFRLSKYQTWMEEFYAANPDFVMPQFRFNEVIAFVERGLEDFSISRETNSFGIVLPFDDSQVTYVWFDALFNYYTSLKYSKLGDKNRTDFADESHIWPTNLHIVGKDIIRFHAIFWPAMLASYFDLGEEKDGVLHYTKSDRSKLPKNILTGGYFTVDGQKMSKSLGNVIDPVDYSNKYSKELLTLYMLSAFPIGNDGDYDRNEAIKLYNAKLANNLGNLVNRVVVLTLKLDESRLSSNDILAHIPLTKELETIKQAYTSYDLKAVLDTSFELLDSLNKYADTTQPWQMIKEDAEKAQQSLSHLAEGLRLVGLYLYPFFPEKIDEMFVKLGLEDYSSRLENGQLEALLNENAVFHISEKGSALFERFDLDA